MREEQRRRKAALQWLALARQAGVIDDATAAVYLTGVEDLPAWAVEHACRQIGYRARGEREKAWPDLGTIREAALEAMRNETDKRTSSRLLTDPKPEPIAPEKLAEINAQFRAILKRRTW